MQDYPLLDEIDHQILMHCEVHFSGSFSLMQDYYAKEGKGTLPEVSLRRILELQKLQEYYDISLSEEVLFDQEKELVALAKERYRLLREVSANQDNSLACRIADLIFSEEEDPSSEIAAVVAFKEKAVLPLLELLSREEFFNPLFPGYGQVPALTARCLGLIGDARAIRPLFEALQSGDFFIEEAIFEALRNIGVPAQDFLLNLLVKMPITKENEQAAIALNSFKEDERIALTCFQQLTKTPTRSHPAFAAYLVMGCHGLKSKEHRAALQSLTQRNDLPEEVREEMDLLLQKWKKEASHSI